MEFKDKLERKLIVGLFAVIILFLAVIDVYFFIEKLTIYGIFCFIEIFVSVIWIIQIFRTIRISLVNLAVMVLFTALFCYLLDQLPVLLWYFIIQLGTLVFANKKTSFYITLCCAVSYVLLLFFQSCCPSDLIDLSEHQLHWLNLLNIAAFCVIAVYLFYCNYRIDKQRNAASEDLLNADEKKAQKEKYTAIYQEIIKIFETEKIFKKSDLTMAELAEKLDTNTTYIQRALKNQGITEGFPMFVNKYRVQAFKNMAKKSESDKFTIGFMYESCGFRHQSSFNKIFKQFESITPSEYISLQKSKRMKQ